MAPPDGFSDQRWHTLKIERRGSQVKLQLDGKEQIKYLAAKTDEMRLQSMIIGACKEWWLYLLLICEFFMSITRGFQISISVSNLDLDLGFGIFHSRFFRDFFEILKSRSRSPGFQDFRDFYSGFFREFQSPIPIPGVSGFFDLAVNRKSQSRIP